MGWFKRKNITFAETQVEEKKTGETPPGAITAVNRDVNITSLNAFVEELPNPNEFFLNGVPGSSSSGMNDYDTIDVMDKKCATIPQTMSIINSITSLPTTLIGDENSDLYKLVKETLIELPNFNNILRRALVALKAGMAIFEVYWDTTQAGRWLIDDLADWHQSRFRFNMNYALEMWNDTEWIKVDERLKFKVATYDARYGNRYGYGLANWYYWPFFLQVGGAKRWTLDQDGYVNPRLLIAPGDKDAKLRDETKDAAKSFASTQKQGQILIVPDYVNAMILKAPSDGADTHEKYTIHWSKEIARLMIGTASHLQERTGGTFAEEKVHKQIRADLLNTYVEWLQGFINDQVIKTLVDVNFGPQEKGKYPKWKIQVPETVPENFIKDISESVAMGLPVDYEFVYKTMGWEPPEEGEANLLKVPDRGGQVGFSDDYKKLVQVKADIKNLVTI